MYIFLILNKKNQNKTSKKNKQNKTKRTTTKNKQTNKTKQKNPHGFNQNLPRKQSISLSYNM